MKEVSDYAIGVNLNVSKCTGWVALEKKAGNKDYLFDSTNIIC